MTPQKDGELLPLIYLLGKTGCRSVLEIGSANGFSFFRLGMLMDKAVAVDLPGEVWRHTDFEGNLLSVRDELRRRFSVKAEVILGNSRDPMTVEKARALGPYDAVFIDADHRYEGVKSDWENYGPMAKKLVAFHDIDGHGCIDPTSGSPVEVPRLWDEIRGSRRSAEFIQRWEGPPMGIGVLLL